MNPDLIILGICAYLLGSIPFAVLVSKGFHGIDVREHGSGNAGATNVFRVLGVKSGTIVLLLDIFKGMRVLRYQDYDDAREAYSSIIAQKP